MPWTRKEEPTPFDNLSITGLYFLVGNVVARKFKWKEVQGKKHPMLAFPSGLECPLIQDESGLSVQIFSVMVLPLEGERDQAYSIAASIARVCRYRVDKVDQDQIEFWAWKGQHHYLVTYDNDAHQIADVTRLPDD